MKLSVDLEPDELEWLLLTLHHTDITNRMGASVSAKIAGATRDATVHERSAIASASGDPLEPVADAIDALDRIDFGAVYSARVTRARLALAFLRECRDKRVPLPPARTFTVHKPAACGPTEAPSPEIKANE